MKKLFLALSILSLTIGQSQDFQGLQTSNYAGVIGVFSNPANIADNRMTFDMSLFGLNFIADNNYVGVKRSSLTGGVRNWGQGGNWDTVRRESPDYWKNNFITKTSSKDKSIYTGARVMLPSFMVSLNHKSSIAFNWSIRNYVNVDGISPSLAKLAYEEFVYPSLWVTDLNNKNLNINQMSWAEYGLSYARVLKEDGVHFFKAGGTAKLLQGIEAAYVRVKNLDYNFYTSDTLSIFQSEVEYGHSNNLDPLLTGLTDSKFDPMDGLKYMLRNAKFPGFGFDVGMVYEFRPEFEKHKFDMDGEKGLWRRDQNKYKTKVSFAVNDIGGIRFKKGLLSNDFTADVKLWNLKAIDVNSIDGYDSLMTNLFGSKASPTTFKMSLPTSINLGVDQHIWKTIYVNLTGNFCNLQPNKVSRVHDFTTVSLAPRFDHKWFGLTLPITYSAFSAKRGEPILFGTMVRLGPLIVGTNNMPGLFFKDIYGASLYATLKIPVPAGHPRDRDKDGISDKKDLCVAVPGVWEFMGCPDKDGDHIQDKEDKCPEVPGHGDVLTLDTSHERTPAINGIPVDYAPPKVFESPFLNAEYNTGVVTISKGGRTKVLDFNR